MNTPKFRAFFSYVLLCLTLFSCELRSEPPLNMVPAATSTQFPIVKATLTPTQFVTPTFPPSPPTLAFEIQDQLYDALQTNGGCELPCFLGVQPGKTSIQGAFDIFEPYKRGSILPFTFWGMPPIDGYSIFVDTSKDTTLDFSLDLMASSGIVQGVIVGFHAPVRYDVDKNRREDLTDRHLERYGILDLFRHHGIPDEIYITPPHTQDTIAAYGIDVIYNHSQIMGMYSGIAKLDKNGIYELCPSIGDGQVGGFMLIVAAPSIDDMPYFFLSTKVKNFSSSTLDAYRESQKLDTQGIYNLFMKENKRCFYEDQFFVE
jgi:hypothetical protein